MECCAELHSQSLRTLNVTLSKKGQGELEPELLSGGIGVGSTRNAPCASWISMPLAATAPDGVATAWKRYCTLSLSQRTRVTPTFA